MKTRFCIGVSAAFALACAAFAQPANDLCANATAVGEGSFPFSNQDGGGIFAGTDGTSTCGFNGNNSDVWFMYTPTVTGNATVDTCGSGSGDTVLTAFSSCGGAQIACNDDFCGLRSTMSFAVTAGVPVLISIAEYNTGPTLIDGTLTISAGGGGGSDDECTGTLTALTLGSNATDTTGYTSSADACNFGGPDRWYTFTATNSAAHVFSFCGGASYDTVLAVYDSCGGTLLGCNDDFCGLQSQLTASLTGGSTYFVKVDGFGGGSGPGTLTITEVTAPGNDNCAAATAIAGTGSFPFDTLGATTDGADSCSFAGAGSGNDVWYAWTPSTTDTHAINTCGTGWDTLINVFDTCGGTEIACNDDSCGLSSQVTGTFTAGTTYLIRIANWGTGSGANGNFNILVLAPDDECTGTLGALTVGSNATDTTGYTSTADAGCNFSGPDRWYTFTFPTAGAYLFSMCGSGYDTVLAAYDSCGGTLLGCNDDSVACGLQSEMIVCGSSGQTIFVKVDGFGGGSGPGTLTISAAVPPANDTCGSATAISGVGSFAFDTTGACTEAADSCSFGGAGSSGDVWFAWTAPSTGTFQANTCSTGFDTLVNVFDTCGGTEVACNDDFCGLSSGVSISATGGTTYLIRVANWGTGAGANGNLDILEVVPPANDTCASATAVGEGSHAFDNTFATTDGADSCSFGGAGSGNDVWFLYTPTFTGTAEVNTCGSTGIGDTLINAFDACGGTEIACNDDFCGLLSQMFVPVTAGTPVVIRVAGWNAAAPAFGAGTLFIGEAVCNTFDTTVCGDATQDEACFDPFANPDVTNGGCNSSPEVYSTINCGQTVAGTVSVYPGANPGDLWRDTDWYAFSLTGTETVTFTAQAEFNAIMFLIDMNAGCGGAFIVGQDTNNLPCTDMSLTATLNAGSYVAFMSAQFTGENLCDGVDERYWMNMSIEGNSCNCDIDYNNDGLFPDNQDLQDYLDVFGGAACPSACCDSIDFNRDGLFPDNQDLQDYFDVFGGAPCPY